MSDIHGRSPSKKKVVQYSKSAANHFLWKGSAIYGEKLSWLHVECYWYDEYDTLHLPIPVLYEVIFLHSEHDKDYEKLIITITFGNRNPGAADDVLFPARTMCRPSRISYEQEGLLRVRVPATYDYGTYSTTYGEGSLCDGTNSFSRGAGRIVTLGLRACTRSTVALRFFGGPRQIDGNGQASLNTKDVFCGRFVPYDTE